MAIGSKINRFLENISGMKIKKYFPRPSVLYAKKHFNRPITVVEIGVFRGEHSRSILKTLPIKQLYLVDPYLATNEYSQKKLDKVFRKAKALFPKKKVTFVKKLSHEAAEELPNELDFVYMDGDDRYEPLTKDLETYWRKLRRGGILAGHDFWKSPQLKEIEVVKAVTEFAVKNNLDLNVHQEDWWIIKK